MKTELQVKFLQHLAQKRKNEGFTLIELLVVIIIIGILSAIALPSFLNQSAKARASEARTNVGALNRSQQSYYLENQTFSDEIAKLGVGITNSTNYVYEITSAGTAAYTTGVVNRALSQNKDLKGHIGAVFSTGGQTPSVLCQSNTAEVNASGAMTAPALGTGATASVPACGAGTAPVGK